MKLIASLIISSILAVPLKFQPSTDIHTDINIISNVDISTDIEATIEQSSNNAEIVGLFDDIAEDLDEETIAMIDQMSPEDWDDFFNTMTEEFEQLSGINLQNIDDMSDEEFQSLLNSITE